MKKDSIWKTKIGPFLAACLAVGNGQAQSTFTQVTTGPIATDSGEFIIAVWGDFHNAAQCHIEIDLC